MEQESKTSTVSDTRPSEADYNSSKAGEEGKYTYASIKPNKSNKMSALSRIKTIQENDWKTWKGPNVRRAGRPGTAGLIKNKSRKDPDILEVQDDIKFK